MILTWIFEMVLGVVRGLLSLLPNWNMGGSSITSLNNSALGAGSLDGWVPESFIFLCLGLMVAARLWFFVAGAVQWLYHLIPFNGG